MAQDINSLIEKINQEGVLAAEQKAREIENDAKQKAARILEQAEQEATRLLSEAKVQISKMQEREKTLLEQAGRDLLLTLRQEINAMLERLIIKEVQDALSSENVYKILSNLVKCASGQEKEEIIISLDQKDLKIIEDSFLAKLKTEAKREIVLRSAESIKTGFMISFDSGKSQFDFSDKALADYIGTFLKPRLKEILSLGKGQG